ncbi:putative glycosyltransferase [Metallosphaera yellowstonensis MK1]|jgi:GT2 family glycosyltransferase|uniref:Putative glycosyltransferase n=1 Tax=Metallosphaera yellowstonensis MK1 TaxID=671065 RepID=H2C0J9_9CREN|nr:glycosyltransferase family 2 protein [Metallosphaera yellowstonensis]EHP71261.1 putative glycosyltransferase [Metallosphaera yellowstonensis MK1]
MNLIPIVIINYNGAELLRRYLDSVLETDYPEKEVIVIDNGSKDESVSYLMEKGVKTIQLGRNYGPAYARNVALKTFKTKYMAFLDNDVMTPKDWLYPLLESIEGKENIAACQSLYGNWPYPEHPREVPWFSTASALTRREVISKLGGFDEHYFFYWEDAELSWRLYRAGYKVLMVPKSKVYHEVHGTFKKLPSPFTSYLFLRNQLLLLATYYDKKRLLTTFPALLMVRLFQITRGVNKLARLRAILSLIPETKYLLKKRSDLKKITVDSSDSFLQMMGDEVFGYSEFRSMIEGINKKLKGRGHIELQDDNR